MMSSKVASCFLGGCTDLQDIWTGWLWSQGRCELVLGWSQRSPKHWTGSSWCQGVLWLGSWLVAVEMQRSQVLFMKHHVKPIWLPKVLEEGTMLFHVCIIQHYCRLVGFSVRVWQWMCWLAGIVYEAPPDRDELAREADPVAQGVEGSRRPCHHVPAVLRQPYRVRFRRQHSQGLVSYNGQGETISF